MATNVIDHRVECPQCGAEMVKRTSFRGDFYGCSKYPNCRGTRPAPQKEGETAPVQKKGWASHSSSFASNTALLKGSDQQELIWKEATNPKSKSHLVIDAVAGSGKSTTLVELIKRENKKLSIAVFAFNVHIARDMNEKISQAGITNAQALTYNSLGWRAVKSAYPSCMLMQDKLDTIMQEIIPDDEYRSLAPHVEKIVRLLKCHLFKATDSNMEDLVAKFGMDADSNLLPLIYRYAPKVLAESVNRRTVADYDDQVYWPVLFDLPVVSYDRTMIDEAQDTSLVQQKLALRTCPKGRIIVVGDKHQAIYGFRGADVTAIARIKEELDTTSGGTKTMPLTVSRRCPKSHVELVQKIVPHITAMPDAMPGVIRTLDPDKATMEMKPGDLVLCRVNAPLVGACYTLIKSGVRAIVRGRDIGKGLTALIRRLKPASILELIEKLRDYETKELAKLAKFGRKSDSKVVALHDKADCLIMLCDGTNDLSELQRRIDQMFSDFDESGKPKDFVVFSTVHKGKGLEAHNVFILSPELIPHPMAKAAWEKEQEFNLAYVAGTRSKYDLKTGVDGTLTFCGQIPPAFGGPAVTQGTTRPKTSFRKDSSTSRSDERQLPGRVPFEEFLDGDDIDDLEDSDLVDGMASQVKR